MKKILFYIALFFVPCFCVAQITAASKIKIATGNNIGQSSLGDLGIFAYASSAKFVEIKDEFMSFASNTATSGISDLQWNRTALGANMTGTINMGFEEEGVIGLNGTGTVGNYNFLQLSSGSAIAGNYTPKSGDTLTYVFYLPSGLTSSNFTSIACGIARTGQSAPIDPVSTQQVCCFYLASPTAAFFQGGDGTSGGSMGITTFPAFATSTTPCSVKIWFDLNNCYMQYKYNNITSPLVTNAQSFWNNPVGALTFRPFFQVKKDLGTGNFTYPIGYFSLKRITNRI